MFRAANITSDGPTNGSFTTEATTRFSQPAQPVGSSCKPRQAPAAWAPRSGRGDGGLVCLRSGEGQQQRHVTPAGHVGEADPLAGMPEHLLRRVQHLPPRVAHPPTSLGTSAALHARVQGVVFRESLKSDLTFPARAYSATRHRSRMASCKMTAQGSEEASYATLRTRAAVDSHKEP